MITHHSLKFDLFLRYFLRKVGNFRGPKFGVKNYVAIYTFCARKKEILVSKKWATHENHISDTKSTEHRTM